MVVSAAAVWVHGLPIDWVRCLAGGRHVELPTYPFQRSRFWMTSPVRAQERSAVDDCRYRVCWQPVGTSTEPPELAGRWILAGTAQDPVMERLSAVLKGAGAEVELLRVEPDAGRDTLAEQLRIIEPDGVVSLLGLGDVTNQAQPVVNTVLLVQALADASVCAPLWSLTCGAVAALDTDQIICPGQAQVWGLGRVVGLEHPDLWGGLVDLPDQLDDRAAALLVDILATREGEDQLAVRSSGLLARRLIRAPAGRSTKTWRPIEAALITGGTGSLGKHVARWLVASGVRHLVLVSRSGGEAPGAQQLCAELTTTGATVTTAACDVADRAAVAEVIRQAEAVGPPIRTVVHAAGSGRSARVLDTDAKEIAGVLAPKVTGAQNLHELLPDLDTFVLFSSGAGVWGSGSQGIYAAANAYLDALAEHRRGHSLPATSISWGAWAGEGMASGAAEDWLRTQGIRFMSPELAIGAMQQVLDLDDRPMVIADIDWQTFAPRYGSARWRPLISEIPEAKIEPEPVTEVSALTAPLAGLTADERYRVLLMAVRTQVALVLGYSNANAVSSDRPFRDLGFDSVSALKLRNRLATATGLSLSATVIFDHPTPAVLSEHLDARIGSDNDTARSTVLDNLAALESAVAKLSSQGLPQFMPDERERTGVTTRLRNLVAKWEQAQGLDRPVTRKEIDDVADDDLFEFIDAKFGRS